MALILILFGPRRLPRAGATLGKTLRNLKEAYSGKVQEARFRRLSDPGEENKMEPPPKNR